MNWEYINGNEKSFASVQISPDGNFLLIKESADYYCYRVIDISKKPIEEVKESTPKKDERK
jgi:hypothetical protein